MKLFLLLCFLFYASLLTAQSTGIIIGKILDIKGEPVAAATVALFSSGDSSLVKVSVTDEKGIFEIQNVKAGNYFLKVSSVGYDNYSSEIISTDGSQTLELPAITLESASVNLSGVTVTAQKPMIEVKPDKTIFNVENSINSTGSTAMELLQKSPGVVVDQNDNILLKGRGGVQVQIDGKPTQLSSTDLGDLLRSMQSSDIESIELISNPSSKYEAEGTAGIINIKLKKNKSFGTNGSITTGYAISTFSKYNGSFTLNHRGKKLNLFASDGTNVGTRLNHLNIYREQNDSIYDEHSTMIFKGRNNNFKAGADYYLNQKNTIGVLVTGNLGHWIGDISSRTDISGAENGELSKILIAKTDIDGHRTNLNFNGNYHFADTSGHDLTADADYGIFKNRRTSFLPNAYLSPDESIVIQENDYRTVSPTDISIYSLKSDYSQNLLNGKLGMGFKVSWVNTDNTYDFYSGTDGADHLVDSLSNRFVYTENINAAYLNYDHSILKKLDLQVGLRMEQTNSNGVLTSVTNQENENVKRHYLNFFPTGGLSYTVNPKNTFNLSYSRRIDRPGYQDLNPFQFKLDELSYRKGNPFLRPQYTDKIEFSHTYNNALNTTLSYSYTSDFVAQVTDSAEGGVNFITSENLAIEEVISLDVNYSAQLFKWWNVFADGIVYRSHYFADFGDGKSIDISQATFNFYGQNTFTLPLNFSLELSGYYSSPSIWGGTYFTDMNWSINAGLQKKIFKNRGTLKAAVSDIFHTQPWFAENKFGGFYLLSSGDWESRELRLTFTYRFGNNQVKGGRQHKTGNEEEMQRVGSGDQ